MEKFILDMPKILASVSTTLQLIVALPMYILKKFDSSAYTE